MVTDNSKNKRPRTSCSHPTPHLLPLTPTHDDRDRNSGRPWSIQPSPIPLDVVGWITAKTGALRLSFPPNPPTCDNPDGNSSRPQSIQLANLTTPCRTVCRKNNTPRASRFHQIATSSPSPPHMTIAAEIVGGPSQFHHGPPLAMQEDGLQQKRQALHLSFPLNPPPTITTIAGVPKWLINTKSPSRDSK
jgi:hypothetical protein